MKGPANRKILLEVSLCTIENPDFGDVYVGSAQNDVAWAFTRAASLPSNAFVMDILSSAVKGSEKHSAGLPDVFHHRDAQIKQVYQLLGVSSGPNSDALVPLI